DLYVKDGEIYFIYSFPRKGEHFFRLKKSKDGLSFSDTEEQLKIIGTTLLSKPENPDTIDELVVTQISEESHFSTYSKKDHNHRTKLYGATSSDGKNWKKTDLIDGVHSFGMIVPEYLFEDHRVLYFGNSSLRIATSPDLKTWHIMPGAILKSRKDCFDYSALKIARVLNVDEYIAVFYFAKNIHKKLCLGVALFDKEAPGRMIWRSESPLWEQPAHWIANKTKLLGILQTDEEFLAYFEHGRGEIFVHKLHYSDDMVVEDDEEEIDPKKKKLSQKKKEKELAPTLTRSFKNPIIEPNHENHWEAAATFNSAALYLDNRVHLIYRAQDHGGISVFGYASSSDGINIDERSDSPVYFPYEVFETSKGKKSAHPFPCVSGGGWGGCEDPRLTQIEDKIYMIYIAFNGYQPPGVALTSIKTDDFLNKIWKWETPKLISRPGQIQKNWVIFPEKINGKFAVLHSITPKISIDYLESLDPDDVLIDSYHTHQHFMDKERWDNIVRGVGAPPLKTEYGWLVLYHAMDFRDPNRYKVGAMLLDAENPERILARSTEPILEPDEKYENEGFKSGVVYVCGAVIKDGTLFVYYGGADMFVAVASAPLKEFMEQLLSSGKVRSLITKK
ncbi:MAG: hypothetical protein WCG73_00890, partial [Candidatus Moraniibacteriota bacterium]